MCVKNADPSPQPNLPELEPLRMSRWILSFIQIALRLMLFPPSNISVNDMTVCREGSWQGVNSTGVGRSPGTPSQVYPLASPDVSLGLSRAPDFSCLTSRKQKTKSELGKWLLAQHRRVRLQVEEEECQNESWTLRKRCPLQHSRPGPFLHPPEHPKSGRRAPGGLPIKPRRLPRPDLDH